MTPDCCQTSHPNVKGTGALKTIDAFRSEGEWREKQLSTFSKTVQESGR